MPDLTAVAGTITDAATERYSLGRPSILTNQVTVAKLLDALRSGNYREIACKTAGVSKQAFYRHLDADEIFRNAVEKAEADAECDLVAQTTAAGRLPQFWAANMTLLERKHPDRWGRRQEDSSTPKVIVQIGLAQAELKVNVIESTAVRAQLSGSEGDPPD